MTYLVLFIDGIKIVSELKPMRSEIGIEVPLVAFAEAIHADITEQGVDGKIALCRGDLCVPIDSSSRRNIEGRDYVPLEAFGDAFGLRWKSSAKELRVDTNESHEVEGLGMGQIAPPFALPDMYSGEPVSSQAFRGRKSVFFMWASW